MKQILKKHFLSGLLAFLPLTVLISVAIWLWDFIVGFLNPIATYFNKSYLEGIIWNEILVVAMVSGIILIVGVVLNTRVGSWLFSKISSLFMKIPGYKIISTILEQFLATDKNKSAFREVCWAKPFGAEGSEVLAFVTEEIDNDVLVFAPTSPNPTSGFVYRLPKKLIRPSELSVESAFQVIVACGKGIN